MPKKAKDTVEKVEKSDLIVEPKGKKSTAKKASTKTASIKTNKKVSEKKIAKTTKSTKKVTTKKTDMLAKVTKTKKVAKTATPSKNQKIDILEYYDLPYRYNQTVVKVLAQTPSTLFVYWDISDEDKNKYIEQFGEYFFHNTKPILIVHNENKNDSYEIDINDYSNSWYLQVADSKCKYKIELGRRSINSHVSLPNHYLHVASSNKIETPNDHILFKKLGNFIVYENVKTSEYKTKDISSLAFLKNVSKIYKAKEFYHAMYKNEAILEDIFDFSNPSSGNPSSTFK